MSVKNRILLTTIFTSFAFWIPVWLPFAAQKNIDIGMAYSIIALYSTLVVLLEYPTGVIGDTYSHKASTMLGYLVTGISSMIMAFAGGIPAYVIGVALFALGTSLISGSDQSYFHSILPDYRNFYPTMKNAGLIATLFGISIGTLLFNVYGALPLLLNAFAFIIAFFAMMTLPNESVAGKDSKLANPFYIAKLGLKTFLTSRAIQSLLIIYAIIFAFSNNLKWLFGNLLDIIHLPVAYWGVLIAVFYLGRFVGIQIQKRLHGKKSTMILLIALANLIFILSFIYNPILIIAVIFLTMVVIGATETDLELDIQENTPNEVRSSILSLKSLLGRGAAALYIGLAGLLITPESSTKLTLVTFALILFAIGLQISNYVKRKELSR